MFPCKKRYEWKRNDNKNLSMYSIVFLLHDIGQCQFWNHSQYRMPQAAHTHTHSTSSKPRFRAWFILCVKYMIYDMIYLKHHRLQTYTQHRVLYVLTCRIFRAFLVHFVCILHACKGWNAKWTSHEQTHKFAQDWDTINVDVETCRTCAAERLFSSPCIADMLQQVKSPPNHAPVI